MTGMLSYKVHAQGLTLSVLWHHLVDSLENCTSPLSLFALLRIVINVCTFLKFLTRRVMTRCPEHEET